MRQSPSTPEPYDSGVSSQPGAPTPAAGDGALTRLAAAVPPPGLLLVSIISIQLGAAVAVNLFPVIGPVATVFLRVTFSAILLLFVARHTITRSALRHAPSLVLYGVILGVMNLCFYGAIARIPLGIAVAVEFIGPLGVAVATSRRPRDFAWIALAAMGILLLTPEIGGTLDPVGVALAAGAGLCWAGFILMSRRMGRIMPGSSGLAIGMTVAALVVLPVELVVGGLGALDPILLGAALAVAVLSTALPLSLEFEALKRMSARSYGIIVTLEPVAAAVIGALLLDQAMGLQGALAVVCVTIAALGVTLSDRRDATALQPM
jgi:inner membrane transporter RhtA